MHVQEQSGFEPPLRMQNLPIARYYNVCYTCLKFSSMFGLSQHSPRYLTASPTWDMSRKHCDINLLSCYSNLVCLASSMRVPCCTAIWHAEWCNHAGQLLSKRMSFVCCSAAGSQGAVAHKQDELSFTALSPQRNHCCMTA